MQCIGHQALLKGFNMWQHKVKLSLRAGGPRVGVWGFVLFSSWKPGAQLQICRQILSFIQVSQASVSPWTASPAVIWNTWYLGKSLSDLPILAGRDLCLPLWWIKSQNVGSFCCLWTFHPKVEHTLMTRVISAFLGLPGKSKRWKFSSSTAY